MIDDLVAFLWARLDEDEMWEPMITTTRTLTCNYCGQWMAIGDTETAREARKRAKRRGWRTLPNADQRGALMDACPDPAHPRT